MCHLSALNMSQRNSENILRYSIPVTSAFSVLYAIVVLWYVGTFPELGIRCLLPRDVPSAAAENINVPVSRFVGVDEDSQPYVLQSGDELLEINDYRVRHVSGRVEGHWRPGLCSAASGRWLARRIGPQRTA